MYQCEHNMASLCRGNVVHVSRNVINILFQMKENVLQKINLTNTAICSSMSTTNVACMQQLICLLVGIEVGIPVNFLEILLKISKFPISVIQFTVPIGYFKITLYS